MLKISHLNPIYFLRYAHMRYMKSLFTNIPKAYFLRNLQTSRAINSRILRIKNVKFSGYCFYMNTNILKDFQICISVPLRKVDFLNVTYKFAWNVLCTKLLEFRSMLRLTQNINTKFTNGALLITACRVIFTWNIWSMVLLDPVK